MCGRVPCEATRGKVNATTRGNSLSFVSSENVEDRPSMQKFNLFVEDAKSELVAQIYLSTYGYRHFLKMEQLLLGINNEMENYVTKEMSIFADIQTKDTEWKHYPSLSLILQKLIMWLKIKELY